LKGVNVKLQHRDFDMVSHTDIRKKQITTSKFSITTIANYPAIRDII